MSREADEHNFAVYEFMKEAAARDPEGFKEVCKRFPTKNMRAIEKIRRREITFSGLSASDCDLIGLPRDRYDDE